MALQPKDVQSVVRVKVNEVADKLEAEIDRALQIEWDGHLFRFTLESRLDAFVLQEILRRYHGWHIKEAFVSQNNKWELQFTVAQTSYGCCEKD